MLNQMKKCPWPVLIVSIRGRIIGQKKMTGRLQFIKIKGGNYKSAGPRTRHSLTKDVVFEEMCVKMLAKPLRGSRQREDG